MSEEIKTETTTATPTVTKQTVELSQDKVDSLINDAYHRGAKNGNKELGTQLNDAQGKIEELNRQISQQSNDLAFEKISSQYDVSKTQYVRPELENAMKSEDFNLETFMEDFKGREPSFFKDGNKPQPMRVDSTNNNQQAPDFNSKVKTAKSMAEIYALQKEL